MARKEDSEGEIRISSPDDNRMGVFGRSVITFLVLVAIALTCIFVVVRMDGGRIFISNWLSQKVGMEVDIGSAHIGLPYVLVLNNVVSKTFKTDEDPGFSAQEVRIGVTWRAGLRVVVNGGRLNLTQETDDNWQPEFFARMGDLPIGNITDVSRITERFRNRVEVRVKDGTVHWYSNVIGAKPSVRGLAFEVKPARIDSEKMFYHSLSVYHVVGLNGEKGSDIERCWLASEGSSYIELDRVGDDLPAGLSAFWEEHEVGSNEGTPAKKELKKREQL